MKTVVLIDGGHLRACAKASGRIYDNNLIERFGRACVEEAEYLMRIYYYDAPQYRGQVKLPLGGETSFQASDRWLDELARLERFAVRRGTLGFRGWKLKPGRGSSEAELTNDDFAPVFEQKGVDMRIGLDIASVAERRTAERVVLVSGDTDMIPAMKHARKAGLEVVIAHLPKPALQPHYDLQAHADLLRLVAWP